MSRLEKNQAKMEENGLMGLSHARAVVQTFVRGQQSMTGWKRISYVLAVVLIGVGLAACSTPDAVKQLSTAQVGNLDAAVVAVEAQGRALVTLAEQVKKERETRIDALHKRRVERFRDQAADGFPGQEDKISAAENAFGRVSNSERERTTAIARLDSRLKVIKAKNEELIGYIRKLKDAQEVLDGYLQSERVGEALLGEAMNVPFVSEAIGAVNTLKAKVLASAGELNGLVGQFIQNFGEN